MLRSGPSSVGAGLATQQGARFDQRVGQGMNWDVRDGSTDEPLGAIQAENSGTSNVS